MHTVLVVGFSVAARITHAHTTHHSFALLPPQLLNTDSSAYEQLEMERGVCNLQRTYTPELIQRKALESPAALLAIVARTTEIATRLGSFYGSLVLDSFTGTSDEPDRIRMRAAQLRYAVVYIPGLLIALSQGDAHGTGPLVHQGRARYAGGGMPTYNTTTAQCWPTVPTSSAKTT